MAFTLGVWNVMLTAFLLGSMWSIAVEKAAACIYDYSFLLSVVLV